MARFVSACAAVTSGRAKLEAMGGAYIAFAQEEPVYFGALAHFEAHPGDAACQWCAADDKVHLFMTDAIREGMADGSIRTDVGDADAVGLHAWGDPAGGQQGPGAATASDQPGTAVRTGHGAGTGRLAGEVMTRQLLGTAVLLLAMPTPGQARSFEAVTGQYVAEALQSNLGLQGQDLQVERSAAALAAARARFWPELSLNARYSWADGGRNIDFPIGQLLNPAYQTLNQLLAAQGQPPRFGTINDQSFAFQRPQEQDTRVSLRQPLYQPAIPAAVAAQRELLGSERYARLALARQLRRDLIVGYAGWLMAQATSASCAPAWPCWMRTCGWWARCTPAAASPRTRCCGPRPNSWPCASSSPPPAVPWPRRAAM